jgi:hypothetical protein
MSQNRAVYSSETSITVTRGIHFDCRMDVVGYCFVYSSTKLEAIRSSEMSVKFYQTARRHAPERSIIDSDPCEWIWRGAVTAYLEMLCRHFPGRTKENHGTP